MNLPGGVPPSLLPYLKLVHLSSPVSSRAELAVLTLYLQMSAAARRGRLNQDVFANANAERIRRSMGLVTDYVRRPLSVRRTTDLHFLVGFLTDYPHEHRGNIVGLTEKSIRWHRCEQEREVEKMLSRLGGDKPTKYPPAPLPMENGVEFLNTVGRVCEEGVRMHNCAASYAERAVRGWCYLFHVVHDGEEVRWRLSSF